MKIDKEKVDAEMEKIKNRFKSQEDFKTALERSGITEENLRKQVEKIVCLYRRHRRHIRRL